MTGRRLNPVVEGAAEMLRSGARLGWAMSLLGAQGLARAVSGGGDFAAALDDIATATEHELGKASQEMIHSGRRVQRDLVHSAHLRASQLRSSQFQVAQLCTGLREHGGARRLGAALIEGGAGGARRALSMMAPTLGARSLRRAADLLFAAENFAATALEPLAAAEDGASEQLRRQAKRLLRLDPYSALWRLEGLGHAYGETLDSDEMRGRQGRSRKGSEEEVEERPPEATLDVEGLPSAARMPILTGAGLSLSRRFLRRGVDARGSARRHAELCRRWAPAGSGLMLFEATGFVAHQLMPLSFEELAQGAESLGEEARAAFYHGAGRALYLSLRSLFDSRHPLERALALADGSARRNAVAGVVWAATLVHLRHPGPIEDLLETAGLSPSPVSRGLRLRDPEAAAVDHGLAGALTVWMNHVKDRRQEPLDEPYLAALKDQASPRLQRAVERARRRIPELEDGRCTWDDVYLFSPASAEGQGKSTGERGA